MRKWCALYGPMSDALAIAIVTGFFTAVPAGLAAYAALVKARQAEKQLQPSNGHTVANMVEEMWKYQAQRQEDHFNIEVMLEEVNNLNRDLRSHMDDAAMHYREQHNFCQHGDGNAVCPNCLAPRDH